MQFNNADLPALVYPINAIIGTFVGTLRFYLNLLFCLSSISSNLFTLDTLSSINLLYISNADSPDPIVLPTALRCLALTTSKLISLALIKSP